MTEIQVVLSSGKEIKVKVPFTPRVEDTIMHTSGNLRVVEVLPNNKFKVINLN